MYTRILSLVKVRVGAFLTQNNMAAESGSQSNLWVGVLNYHIPLSEIKQTTNYLTTY